MNIDLENQILPAYRDFFYDKSYYSILRGSRGSGKSRAICQKIVFRILAEKNHLIIVIRDKMTDHVNSTFREFKEVAEQFQVIKLFEFYKAPLSIRIPSHNSEILFLGMDDSQRLKGLSGTTMMWWEEATQIREQSSFEEVMSGFRPKRRDDSYEQVILSFNPISNQHWIKKRFYDENPDRDRTFEAKTTYLDNPYLNPNTVTTLLNLRYTDEQKYRVNVMGEWGKSSDGKEFYKNFKYSTHVDTMCEATYNENLPLHLSFDFNITPHMTMLVSQIVGKRVRVIAEIIAPNPRNTVNGICQMFREKYPSHNAGVFITGDPSGNARSQASSEYQSNVTRISYELASYNPIIRIGKSAPRVAIRSQFINMIFETCHENISIIINPDCKGLIMDLSELQEDASGLKHKQITKQNGITFEKYGHWSDCFDYLICQTFTIEYNKFSNKHNGLTNLEIISRGPLKYRY
jgi:phage terminase large subunit